VLNQGGKRFPLPGQVIGGNSSAPRGLPASGAATVSPVPGLSLALAILLGAWVVW
jgi:hypothetical protein